MTFCTRVFLLSLGFLFSSILHTTASPDHQWSRSFGGTGFDQAHSVVVDAWGNVIVLGSFEGTINLGGDDLVSSGSNSICIAKYDSHGAHQWSHGFGTTLGFGTTVMAVNPAGVVYMAGSFMGTVNFGGGDLVTDDSETDIFMAVFDADGLLQGNFQAEGTGSANCRGIAIDNQANVFLAGEFTGTLDFGMGEMESSGWGSDIYLGKWSYSGTPIWSKRFGNEPNDGVSGIAVDPAGSVILVGESYGSVNFGGDDLFGTDGMMYLAKFNGAGDHLWSQAYEGTINEGIEAVTTDRFGGVLVTGWFHGEIDLGGSIFSGGEEDEVFLAKYNAVGYHVWSRMFGGVEDDHGLAIATDTLGNVCLTGYFETTAGFGGPPLVSNGGNDIVIASYGPDGTHLWSHGLGSGYSSDAGLAVALDGLSHPIVAGQFGNSVDFGGGALVSAGFDDGFLAKYHQFISDVPATDSKYFALLDAYPNPFNPQTTIAFDLHQRGPVFLRVFDLAGRLVKELIGGESYAPGRQEATWNGTDDTGRHVAAGAYFYRLEAGRFSETKRLILVK